MLFSSHPEWATLYAFLDAVLWIEVLTRFVTPVYHTGDRVFNHRSACLDSGVTVHLCIFESILVPAQGGGVVIHIWAFRWACDRRALSLPLGSCSRSW